MFSCFLCFSLLESTFGSTTANPFGASAPTGFGAAPASAFGNAGFNTDLGAGGFSLGSSFGQPFGQSAAAPGQAAVPSIGTRGSNFAPYPVQFASSLRIFCWADVLVFFRRAHTAAREGR